MPKIHSNNRENNQHKDTVPNSHKEVSWKTWDKNKFDLTLTGRFCSGILNDS